MRQSVARLDEDGLGKGLRGGTFADTFDDATGIQTLWLHGTRFSADVAVDGTVQVAEDGTLTATVTVGAPRGGGGTLRLTGRWWTGDDPAGPIRLDGTLGGRTIAVITPGG